KLGWHLLQRRLASSAEMPFEKLVALEKVWEAQLSANASWLCHDGRFTLKCACFKGLPVGDLRASQPPRYPK
ncbi:MAG: hypothetical protein RR650_14740, partial [Comamonas sp.]